MNALITIGFICLIGLGLYALPKVANFIESLIRWHFD